MLSEPHSVLHVWKNSNPIWFLRSLIAQPAADVMENWQAARFPTGRRFDPAQLRPGTKLTVDRVEYIETIRYGNDGRSDGENRESTLQ